MGRSNLVCPGAPSNTLILSARRKPVRYNLCVAAQTTSTGWSKHLCGNRMDLRESVNLCVCCSHSMTLMVAGEKKTGDFVLIRGNGGQCAQ